MAALALDSTQVASSSHVANRVLAITVPIANFIKLTDTDLILSYQYFCS